MANHAGLLECLAVVLRGEHTGLEVKMYCSATLRRMAELIRYPMIAQGALLSALVKAATWTSTDCIAEGINAIITKFEAILRSHMNISENKFSCGVLFHLMVCLVHSVINDSFSGHFDIFSKKIFLVFYKTSRSGSFCRKMNVAYLHI